MPLPQLVQFYKTDRLFACCESNNKNTINESFRVMSWNILADGKNYALSWRHDYCDPAYRAWEYRKTRILASILAYAPDIICLQETTRPMFEDFIQPEFARHGYKAVHVSKQNKRVQSDTICYRANRFELQTTERIFPGPSSDEPVVTVFGPQHNMFR